MNEAQDNQCIAFNGSTRVAIGGLTDVAAAAKAVLDSDRLASVLIFDCNTSGVIEVDFRGSVDDVVRRVIARELARSLPVAPAAEPESARGPGRPKLGVVAREVTLLPRHWDWLADQPGGASVALRKLVEEAKRANVAKDRLRKSQEAAYKFMSALAGDLPGFEEATRALFAADRDRFEALIADWPTDVRDHATTLAFSAP